MKKHVENNRRSVVKPATLKTTVKSELDRRIWAVVDGIVCYAKNLTYQSALGKTEKYPDAIIVTNQAASHLKMVGKSS